MVAFIDTVTDPERADRLETAISGRGAFRRWYAFSEERQCGRARWWLAVQGLRPAVPSTPEPLG